MSVTAISRLVKAVAIVVVAVAAAVAPAAAAPTSGGSSPAEITAAVMHSPDPHAAFHALSAADRATFLTAFANQTSVTVIDRGGPYVPTAAERADMQTGPVPARIKADLTAVSGCWYRYWYKSWYDLGIHDGDSWMQLNWCSSNSRITSWSQSNVGCGGHYGATCKVGGRADLNVGWEVRSTRYYQADFFGFNNTFCMQIRGGATGLYSENSSAKGGCPLS
ncbi:hypothetical protein ACQHIV_37785 [Kribbella sp. GL6]|uniref:hypothetical protein n=1 Tax=Kribbella sp. GL6 TaxID=3419765 RepID=UPI003D06B207